MQLQSSSNLQPVDATDPAPTRVDERRLHILVSLAGLNMAQDYYETGVLDELATNFDLSFVLSPKARGEEQLRSYGPVHRLPADPYWRTMLYTIGKGCWHYHRRRAFIVTDHQRRYRSLIGLGFVRRVIVKTAISLGLSAPIGLMIRQILRWTTPDMLPNFQSVDAVLMVWALESSFNDDTIRDGRKKAVPVLGVQANLDNIATKTAYESVDYAAVWGVQDLLNCVHAHGVRPDRAFVTGSPRFSAHRHAPSKSASREEFEIPKDKRVILFCGTGVPFNETEVLAKLQTAFDRGGIPRDIEVLYRPHPNRPVWSGWEKTKILPAETEFLRAAPEDKLNGDGVAFYSRLFAAADAVISPFSTMVIEAAGYGLPVLCIGYNDKAEEMRFDWSANIFAGHMATIHHGDWALVCRDPDHLINHFEALLERIGDEEIAENARVANEFANRTGRQSVGYRLARALKTIVEMEASSRQCTGRSALRKRVPQHVPSES